MVQITVERPTMSRPQVAEELFEPIAPTYERWAALLSMGQDARWRRAMVDGLSLPKGSFILDVAAGTGSISRTLREHGYRVLSADQSPEMMAMATERGATAIMATAEELPFADNTFDAVTFGYLLRYVEDVPACVSELTRVVRPGGVVAMLDFARPQMPWRLAWWFYTRSLLPLAGAIIRGGWWEVSRFLGPSIETFANVYPPDDLSDVWRAAGLTQVRYRLMSLGGGLVMWGRRQ